MKNYVVADAGMSGTTTAIVLADAQDSAVLSVQQDVEKGCTINQIYISFDVCGLGGTGVLNTADMYLFKNPGSNLTIPSATFWGTSNEKKFIFKTWHFMIMRNQDGNMPFHWEGWVKVPRGYKRMGANDQISFVHNCTTALTGHISVRALYKWYK